MRLKQTQEAMKRSQVNMSVFTLNVLLWNKPASNVCTH